MSTNLSPKTLHLPINILTRLHRTLYHKGSDEPCYHFSQIPHQDRVERMAYGNGQNPIPLPHSPLKGSTNSYGTQTDSPPKAKAPKIVSLITKFEGLDAASVGFEVRDAQPAHLRIQRDNLAKGDTAGGAEDRGKVKRVAEQFMGVAGRSGREPKNSGGPKERPEGKSQCGRLERTDCGRQRAHSKVKERVHLFNESMDPHTPHASKVRDQGKADDSVASHSSHREGPIIIANGPGLHSTSPCKQTLLLATPTIFCEKRSGDGIIPSVERDPHCRIRPEKQSIHGLVVRKEHERLDLLGKQLTSDNCRRMASQSKPTNNPASNEVDPSIERLRKYYDDETSKTISRSKMQEDNTAMKSFYSTVLESVKPRSSEKPTFPTMAQGHNFPTATESSRLESKRVQLDDSWKSEARLDRPYPRKPAPNADGSGRFEAENGVMPSRAVCTGARKCPDAPSPLERGSVWPLPAFVPYGQESRAQPLPQLNPAKKRVRQSIEESEKHEERGASEGKGKGRGKDRPLFVETSRSDFYEDYSNQVESTPPAYVPTPVFRPGSSPPPANDIPQQGKGEEGIEKSVSAAISPQEKYYMRRKSAQMARNARQELHTRQKRFPGPGEKERQKLQAHNERLTRRSRCRPPSTPSIASPRRNEKTKENSFQRDKQDLELEDINAMDGISQGVSFNQEKSTPAHKFGAEGSQSEPAKDVLVMDVIVAQCELAQPKPHRSKEISQMRKICRTGLREGQRDESNKRQ